MLRALSSELLAPALLLFFWTLKCQAYSDFQEPPVSYSLGSDLLEQHLFPQEKLL